MGRKKSRFYKDLPKQEYVDTNALIMDPVQNKLGSLRVAAALSALPIPSKGSSKREKQMEKYIAKKLKKDERPALLARLANSSFTSETLQSTKALLVPSKRAVGKSKENFKTELVPSTEEVSESEEEEGTYGKAVSSKINVQSTKVNASILPDSPVDMLKAISALKKSSLNPLDSDDKDKNSDSDDYYERKREKKDLAIENLLDATVTNGKFSDNTATEAKEKQGTPTLPDSQSTPILLPPRGQAYYVLVQRTALIEEQRLKLPIYAEEHNIMETIMSNPVSIICGETGSGKTTQVPQFLYEAGFGDPANPSNPGLIGVTQPRRVAAVSVAKRIGEELDRPSHVSYQIRYESNVGAETRIKLMTDGILLRELANDFLLRKYSIILLDEAHERNLNTDILIGMLSRVVRMRNQMACVPDAGSTAMKPLRLVIMSATLNIEEFTASHLFTPPPPLIKVEARQHPVTDHFARKTESDYLVTACKMVKKIHANLPAGGILVFLTGKEEISRLARKLTKGKKRPHWQENEDDVDYRSDPESESESDCSTSKDQPNYSNDDATDEFDLSLADGDGGEPLHVLPLYSMLAPEEQMKVFQPPPEGTRLCVIATNVAETSLTIPNIRYVVDCGKVKTRHYDPAIGSSRYEITWCSKASATQRAGRAGRLGPGHCYRLYSSAVYDRIFPAFSVPEIQRCSIDGLVLQLKAMGIDRPENFPLPTPPPMEAITSAQRSLVALKALAPADALYKITPLGRKMSLLPLAPIWSRLLIVALESKTDKVQMLAVALAAVMSVGDPFVDQSNGTMNLDLLKNNYDGDLLLWTRAFAKYHHCAPFDRKRICTDLHCMPKRMEDVHQQFKYLIKMIRSTYPGASLHDILLEFRHPEVDCLRKLIAESLPANGAERIKRPSIYKGKRIVLPAYRLKDRTQDDPDGIAFLHPSSIMAKVPPPTLVYNELIVIDDVQYLKYVTPIESHWLK